MIRIVYDKALDLNQGQNQYVEWWWQFNPGPSNVKNEKLDIDDCFFFLDYPIQIYNLYVYRIWIMKWGIKSRPHFVCQRPPSLQWKTNGSTQGVKANL